jgi:hypothetical protein
VSTASLTRGSLSHSAGLSPAQALACTSRVSRASGVTPGNGGSGQAAACPAGPLVSKTMTGMPAPSTGSSQYALIKPGASGTRSVLRSASAAQAR